MILTPISNSYVRTLWVLYTGASHIICTFMALKVSTLNLILKLYLLDEGRATIIGVVGGKGYTCTLALVVSCFMMQSLSYVTPRNRAMNRSC